MKSFQQRLQQAMMGGNLRVADLARWFDRPHATVAGWVNDGRQPSGAPLDAQDVHERLARLEQAIAKKRGFPLPRCSPQERISLLVKASRAN